MDTTKQALLNKMAKIEALANDPAQPRAARHAAKRALAELGSKYLALA